MLAFTIEWMGSSWMIILSWSIDNADNPDYETELTVKLYVRSNAVPF